MYMQSVMFSLAIWHSRFTDKCIAYLFSKVSSGTSLSSQVGIPRDFMDFLCEPEPAH